MSVPGLDALSGWLSEEQIVSKVDLVTSKVLIVILFWNQAVAGVSAAGNGL